MKTLKTLAWVVAAVLLAACGDLPAGRTPDAGFAPIGMRKVPTAGPGCDAKKVCRIYVALETDPQGKPYVFVYPDVLRISTKSDDVHVVWIILNDDVDFTDPKPIAIQKGDATQWTDKYPTDDDDGNKPSAATYRPKNFHGRFPKGAKKDEYKYAITVQRTGQTPVARDPTIVNSD